MRLEMVEKTQDQMTILKKIEETRKKNVQKKIALLQSSAFHVYMSKVNLIKKLTEIEGKFDCQNGKRNENSSEI